MARGAHEIFREWNFGGFNCLNSVEARKNELKLSSGSARHAGLQLVATLLESRVEARRAEPSEAHFLILPMRAAHTYSAVHFTMTQAFQRYPENPRGEARTAGIGLEPGNRSPAGVVACQ
jgi:hypothetical protein